MLGKFEQAMIIGQLALALSGMAIFILAPRADGPVTLYPITDSAAKALPAILTGPETLILTRGKLSGSYII